MNFMISRDPVVTLGLYDRISVTYYLDPKDEITAEKMGELKVGKMYRIVELEEKKTLSQIAKAWVLLQDLAEDSTDGLTRDDIYREMVRRFGKYEVNVFPDEYAEKYMKLWSQQGSGTTSGWQSEVINKYDGMTEFICYSGMSAWSRKELSRFIEELIDECRQHRIPVTI